MDMVLEAKSSTTWTGSLFKKIPDLSKKDENTATIEEKMDISTALREH